MIDFFPLPSTPSDHHRSVYCPRARLSRRRVISAPPVFEPSPPAPKYPYRLNALPLLAEIRKRRWSKNHAIVSARARNIKTQSVGVTAAWRPDNEIPVIRSVYVFIFDSVGAKNLTGRESDCGRKPETRHVRACSPSTVIARGPGGKN